MSKRNDTTPHRNHTPQIAWGCDRCDPMRAVPDLPPGPTDTDWGRHDNGNARRPFADAERLFECLHRDTGTDALARALAVLMAEQVRTVLGAARHALHVLTLVQDPELRLEARDEADKLPDLPIATVALAVEAYARTNDPSHIGMAFACLGDSLWLDPEQSPKGHAALYKRALDVCAEHADAVSVARYVHDVEHAEPEGAR
jgi:hypothetical protein